MARVLFGPRMLLIIAQYLSNVRKADRIVVLDQGRISEVDSHDKFRP